MADYITNAAPMLIPRGTRDLSPRQAARIPEATPQHLPKFYIFAQRGPEEPQLVSDSERDLMYGTDTFDVRKKYANHATVFANLVNGQGNACMLERVVAQDAGPAANVMVWLDVLPTRVDFYDRNLDGSIRLDSNGSPIILGNTQGYKVKWVTTTRTNVLEMHQFGNAVQVPGNQIDPVTGDTSVRYPMFELAVSSRGDHGNNVGFRLWAPTYSSNKNIPDKLMATQRAYPYYMSVIRRQDKRSSPKVVNTLANDQYTMVTLKPGVTDPSAGDRQVYMGDVFLDTYQNVTDVRYPKLFGDFGDLKVYEDNIDFLSGLFHAAEVPFIDSLSDFTADPEDRFMFNLVTGVSTQNVPYNTFHFVDDVDAVRMSEYSNIYARSGSDGTMNDTVFNQLVAERLNEYLDPNSSVQENAINVESIMYDSGFSLDTKYALASFIAVRKDTFVVLSTYESGGRILTASEEHSVAVALRTALQMYPESDYFGTPVSRGMIVGYSARLRDSPYTKRLPLSADIAIKSARYMGASSGSWKNGFAFDGAPGSVIDYMYDISIQSVPASVRNRNWDVGLNWAQAYDRRSFFFPAFKTVYSDDTSVLNSYFTAMAICKINKVMAACWRDFSGVSRLSAAQYIERVNNFVVAKTQGIFDGRYIIQPDAFMSEQDVIRGYSSTLPVRIYSEGMRTVMVSYVESQRKDQAN